MNHFKGVDCDLSLPLLVSRSGCNSSLLGLRSSTFMDRKGGSTRYFWKWPKGYHCQVMYGLKVYVHVAGNLSSDWENESFPNQNESKSQERGRAADASKPGQVVRVT